MKVRNREINIFSLSLMDVISGAMGAFLIVVVILARYRAVDQANDPEKLRPRLDAAMHALATARAGTEKTFKNEFVAKIKPTTLGLSGGETVPEITALGRALRDDIDTIDNGFADALQGRGAATRALASASEGTEKVLKDRIGAKPDTLGLSRGDSVPEITKLGQALRNDISKIDKYIDPIIQARKAATGALEVASTGTEKIFKDRLGEKPATQGHKPGISAPEIKKFEGALRSDIDTIYRKLRKGKENKPNTLFVVTSVFPCQSGDVSLQIAADEINPSTGRPLPPYTPAVPDRGPAARQGSWGLLDHSLLGSGSNYLLRQPAFTYLNSRAVPGRHYKIYLIGFPNACKGHVMILGQGVRTVTHDSSLDVPFSEGEYVNLSWPHDSIVLSDGKRYGMYYFGAITVGKGADHEISFALASVGARDTELEAMQARVEKLHGPAKKKTDHKPTLTKEAALAAIDKLPVPRDEPSCGRMFDNARRTLMEIKMSLSQSQNAALQAVLEDCATGRFPGALDRLKAVMHSVLAEKKDNTPPPTEKKDNKPTLTKEDVLAEFDKLPIPRDRDSCIRIYGRARYTLNVIMKIPPAQGAAALKSVLDDCRRQRFPDALEKLKAAMHNVLK